MRIRRIPLRVGDNDNRSPLAVQFAQQLHHFHAIHRIQISGRFVSQQQLTVRHYRHGQWQHVAVVRPTTVEDNGWHDVADLLSPALCSLSLCVGQS